jgi:hypothetical protein
MTRLIRAASPTWRLIIICASVLGGLLLIGGILLAILGSSSHTTLKLFGNEFASSSVGVALVFIGAVTTGMTLRQVLKSLNRMTEETGDLQAPKGSADSGIDASISRPSPEPCDSPNCRLPVLPSKGKPDEDAPSRPESLNDAVPAVANDPGTQQLHSQAVNLEDITDHHLELSSVRLEYYHGASIEPDLNRFQSHMSAPAGKRSAPLVIRFDCIDLLIPFDAVVKLERKSEPAPTFEVTYDWLGKRQVLQGDIQMPDSSYGKYDIIGVNSDNDTITLPLSDLRRFTFKHQGPASTPPGQNMPLSVTATIHLKNRASIAVANLRRVSRMSPYCHHHTDIPYMQGSAEVDVPLEKVRSFEFGPIPNTLHITYQDGSVHKGQMIKDDTFDDSYVGFSGFSKVGEVFVWATDVSVLSLEAVQQLT